MLLKLTSSDWEIQQLSLQSRPVNLLLSVSYVSRAIKKIWMMQTPFLVFYAKKCSVDSTFTTFLVLFIVERTKKKCLLVN